MEENVARYGALFPENVAQVSPRRFLPRADSSGALSHCMSVTSVSSVYHSESQSLK
jgi:hypothetical protein